MTFSAIRDDIGSPRTLRNSGSFGRVPNGDTRIYFSTASKTIGNVGTMRSLPPLPMIRNASGRPRKSTLRRDSASDMRRPHPNINTTNAQSRAEIHGSFASSSRIASCICSTSLTSMALDNLRGTFGEDISPMDLFDILCFFAKNL